MNKEFRRKKEYELVLCPHCGKEYEAPIIGVYPSYVLVNGCAKCFKAMIIKNSVKKNKKWKSEVRKRQKWIKERDEILKQFINWKREAKNE